MRTILYVNNFQVELLIINAGCLQVKANSIWQQELLMRLLLMNSVCKPQWFIVIAHSTNFFASPFPISFLPTKHKNVMLGTFLQIMVHPTVLAEDRCLLLTNCRHRRISWMVSYWDCCEGNPCSVPASPSYFKPTEPEWRSPATAAMSGSLDTPLECRLAA